MGRGRAKAGKRGSVTITVEQYQELLRRGAVDGVVAPAGPARPPRRPRAKEFVKAEFLRVTPTLVEFALPILTVSEANNIKWRQKSNRTKEARDRVSRFWGANARAFLAVTEAYHRGDALRLTFTRLSPGLLDGMANLGVSLKGVEDAVAMMMGANDGAGNWLATSRQVKQPQYGVVVTIEIAAPPPPATIEAAARVSV